MKILFTVSRYKEYTGRLHSANVVGLLKLRAPWLASLSYTLIPSRHRIEIGDYRVNWLYEIEEPPYMAFDFMQDQAADLVNILRLYKWTASEINERIVIAWRDNQITPGILINALIDQHREKLGL